MSKGFLRSRWASLYAAASGGPPLDPDLALAFANDVAQVNLRRLRVLLPLMFFVHVGHFIAFHDSALRRLQLPRDVGQWRASIAAAHAAMLPVVAGLIWIAYGVRNERWRRAMGPATATLYLLHGAVCSSFDQIVVTGLTPFVGYCLGTAIVLILEPRVVVGVYLLGAAALATGVTLMQQSADARWASLPNCVTVTIVGSVLAFISFAARRHDFLQRVTIDRQSEELARLNEGLELRVRDQVAEIVSRAEEVERLNAQLQAQVRAQSVELSQALARLMRTRGSDGLLKEGAILGGRFLVGKALGAGGMGAVYVGVDQSTGAPVAIKVIQSRSGFHEEMLRRFIQEVTAGASIAHPAVVNMLHVGVSDDGQLFQVQEFVRGDVLSKRIAAVWSPGDASRLGSVLAEALAAAHAQGVIHRDVKPENVMLISSVPGLKLLDFGIAKLHDLAASAMETATGVVMGTPAYMAPEQILGTLEATDRVDVYAAGVLLFRVISGRLPFDGETAREIFKHHIYTPAPDVGGFGQRVPVGLGQLIGRCLMKQPEERPTAAELARELAGWGDALSVPPLHQVAGPEIPNSVDVNIESVSTAKVAATTRTRMD